MVPSTELNYFIEVANALNLSRAAERLGISQPSLSIAIKRLETSVGTHLLIRQKRGVTLTQAGKQLLSYSKKLLHDWHEIKSHTLASHHFVQGNYILGCHPSVGLHYLAKFLPHLLEQYPKLEIRFAHDISRKITEGVINLSIDIGIVVNPIKHPDLIIQKLFDDEVTFWQAPNANQSIVICDPDLTQTQWLLKQLNKKGVKYSRILPSSNLEIIANLTAHKCGIGILPSSVVSAGYAKKINRLAKMPVYQDEICLVYRHENRGIRAIQEIVQEIKKHLKRMDVIPRMK